MIWLSPKRRLPVVLALLIGLIVVGAIVAHSRGPAPNAGATYTATVVVQTPSGAISRRLDMSFAVSADGRRVRSLRFPGGVPSACPTGRLTGVRVAAGASAAIVAPSAFRLRVALVRSGRVGSLLVSGVFHTFGRESGAIASTFSAAALRACGTGAGYTARAAP